MPSRLLDVLRVLALRETELWATGSVLGGVGLLVAVGVIAAVLINVTLRR